MGLSEARGRLVAVGGAEDKEGDCVILKEFIRLSKGARARVVVMTVATDHPDEVGREYKSAFRRLGVDDTEVVDVSAREDAGATGALEKIAQATALYFTGGDQLHITALMGGTEMQKLIHERHANGLVVGGTSAGAAMMSNSMIIGGGGGENPRVEAVRIGPGMDLLVGALIDTHFSQRGRHGRLLTAVAHYPQDLGLGIDENTALVVSKNEFEVIGAGAVTVIDAGVMSYTNLPYAEECGGWRSTASTSTYFPPGTDSIWLIARRLFPIRKTLRRKAGFQTRTRPVNSRNEQREEDENRENPHPRGAERLHLSPRPLDEARP